MGRGSRRCFGGLRRAVKPVSQPSYTHLHGAKIPVTISMTEQKSISPAGLALPSACILVVAILFAAGLSPFDPFPRNQVTWLPQGKGLRFGDYGVVISKEPLPSARLNRDSSCTLEVRVQPTVTTNGSGTVVGFYTAKNPSQFRLMQWRDFLLIRKDYPGAKGPMKTSEVDLEHAFVAGEPVSFTITAGPQGSVAYRNGLRAASTTRTGLSCGDLTGELVLGNSAVVDNSWEGNILDLVIFDRELTAKEIGSEYARWTANQTIQEPGGDEHTVAHYAFTEGSGRSVNGQPASAPRLYIPEMYKVPHKKILMWPWEETPDKLSVRDLSINIFGFVPFGFVFLAYLTWHRRLKHPAIATVLTGAAISLTIEILQEYIPGRDSGLLDVITNAFGTFLGVVLFRWAPVQSLTGKLLEFLRSGERSLQK
jgi:VanZ like family/Concanavalin A-like lectin/glucanases superfamily